jgi:hypothetical protein
LARLNDLVALPFPITPQAWKKRKREKKNRERKHDIRKANSIACMPCSRTGMRVRLRLFSCQKLPLFNYIGIGILVSISFHTLRYFIETIYLA